MNRSDSSDLFQYKVKRYLTLVSKYKFPEKIENIVKFSETRNIRVRTYKNPSFRNLYRFSGKLGSLNKKTRKHLFSSFVEYLNSCNELLRPLKRHDNSHTHKRNFFCSPFLSVIKRYWPN